MEEMVIFMWNIPGFLQFQGGEIPITSDILSMGKKVESCNNIANGTSCTTLGFLSNPNSTDKVIRNTTKMQNISL